MERVIRLRQKNAQGIYDTVYPVVKTSGIIIDEGAQSLAIELAPFLASIQQTGNYELLLNLPSINNVLLKGKMMPEDLGLQEKMDALSNIELQEIINDCE